MIEKIIIVNNNDVIIWSKNRNQLVKSDIYRVSALWVTNSKWEILLAQRALSKTHNPGCFGPAVAWTLATWETYYWNMIKETQEEIWITDIQISKHSKVLIESEYSYFVQWFTAVIDKNISDFKIQEEEVICLKRISPSDLYQDIITHPEKYIASLKENLNMF